METENRSPQPDLVEGLERRLAAEPWSFDFFQAVRRLEHLYRDRPRVGTARSMDEEIVRFGQKVTLAFEPSTIASFEPGTEPEPGEDDEIGRMLVYFLGLFGSNGPMPLHMTELVIDWANGRSERLDRINQEAGGRASVAGGLSTDAARQLERERLGRFFDVFHHRMISFFYRTWVHHEQAVSFDRAEDPFAGYIGSTAGLASPAIQERGQVPYAAKLHQVSHLANPRAYPEGLEAVLEDYFDVPVEVIEFVGQWIAVPEDCQSRLGEANHRLGARELPSLWDDESDGPDPSNTPEATGISEVVLGERVFDRAQKFRIRAGPMPLERFEQFLPGGLAHNALVDWVRQYVGDALAWDLQLVLDRSPPLAIGGRGQLGLTTWLSDEAEVNARTALDDLIVEPVPVSL